MFTRGYVCHRCQARSLKRAAAAVEAQWQGRASYISLSQQASPADDDHPGAPETAQRQRPQRNGKDTTIDRSAPSRPRQRAPEPQPGRYSGSAVPLPFDPHALLRQNRERQDQKQSVGTATKLDELLGSPDTLEEAWSYFLQNYGSKGSRNLLNPAYQDLKHLQYGAVFRKLLQALATSWAAKPSGHLPRPTIVIQKLQEVGVWRPEFWDAAGWSVAKRIFIQNHHKVENREAVVSELPEELLHWWVMLLNKHSKYTQRSEGAGLSEQINWSLLQQHASQSSHNAAEDRSFGGFQGLPTDVFRRVSSLGLVTCDLLSKDAVTSMLPNEKRRDCDELLKTLLILVNRKRFRANSENLRKILGNFNGAISPVAIDDYIHQINELPERALAMITAANARMPQAAREDAHSEEGHERLNPGQKMLSMHSSRIQRAQNQQNTQRLQQAWQAIQAAYSISEDGVKKCEIPALLYDQLIAAFFANHQGNAALQIWKVMLENGTQPTMKTWTAMLDGALKGKDYKAAEGIWDRMLKCGLPLDEVAWIVRVNSLVRSRRPAEALATLEDLGRRWNLANNPQARESQQKRPAKRTKTQAALRATSEPPDMSAPDNAPQAVKPSMPIINAVIAQLAEMSQDQVLMSVLHWARGFGLSPDTHTFNSLMSVAIKRGNPDDAFRLLQQMTAQGVDADAATYSILFDHILINSLTGQNLTENQVKDKALETLEAVEAQGLQGNKYIYSQLIDRLLKHHDNLPAAQAVLSLMFSKSLEPSEQAYTSLITYFFRRDPPDLQSVNDIVTRVETEFKHVNNYFYDRLLQGYAATDSLEQLVRTLRRMKREGRHPSWQALHEAALSLERAQEWRLLGELVDEVEGREGMLPADVAGKEKTMKGVFYRNVGRLREEGKIGGQARRRVDNRVTGRA